VRGAEHVGVGAVGLFDAHLVGQADLLEVLGHLLAAAEFFHERRVEPGLVDGELRVDEDAVAVEPLDVVALVGGAVSEDVDVVLAHGPHDGGGGDGAAERGRVEVPSPGGLDVERAALNRHHALACHRLAAVYEAGDRRPVHHRRRGDFGGVFLVGLAEIGGVRVDLHALAGHPGHGATGVEPTGVGDAEPGPGGGEFLVDSAHGRA
jgi:hypothetical protein